MKQKKEEDIGLLTKGTRKMKKRNTGKREEVRCTKRKKTEKGRMKETGTIKRGEKRQMGKWKRKRNVLYACSQKGHFPRSISTAAD